MWSRRGAVGFGGVGGGFALASVDVAGLDKSVRVVSMTLSYSTPVSVTVDCVRTMVTGSEVAADVKADALTGSSLSFSPNKPFIWLMTLAPGLLGLPLPGGNATGSGECEGAGSVLLNVRLDMPPGLSRPAGSGYFAFGLVILVFCSGESRERAMQSLQLASLRAVTLNPPSVAG